MDIKDLIPKNKYDISAVSELKKLSDIEIESIIPELLVWIQDMNWPIAEDIVEVLSVHGKVTEPYILNILKSDQKDEIWKFNIITYLLKKNKSFSENTSIMSEVERIAVLPTKGEQLEFVDTAAKYIKEK